MSVQTDVSYVRHGHRKASVMEPERGKQLMGQAREVLSILRSQARRAYVLEVTGTPKAGKSTSVTILQGFFRQAGYQVHLLRERAADCPLPMKGHFFFNAWTTATMLAEVLETHETNTDLLILDRGFFDALIWLELQSRRDQVTPDEKKAFSEFVLMDRWRSLVDVTVIMTVSPEIALKREHQNQIVPRLGSMMNVAALEEFNDALKYISDEYSDKFSFLRIDTTSQQEVLSTNADLLEQLLPRLRAWADPKIAVLPKASVQDIFNDRLFLPKEDAEPALARLATDLSFMQRSAAEQDPNVVQLIAAGVHTHKDNIIVLERDPQDTKTVDYGRRTLWVGCHVDRQDPDLLKASIQCLYARIQQDLHLSTHPNVEFLGLAWDQHQSDTQHLGVMFRVPIVSDYVAGHVASKQFKKMGRASPIKSVFMTQPEILAELAQLDLESWSNYMARNINLTLSEEGTS